MKRVSHQPRRERAWRRLLVGALGVSLIIVLGSPILVLGLPGSWKRHVYQEISFQLIARHVLPPSGTPKEVIRAAFNYTRRHLWLVDDVRPYSGRPFDYLVEGIGWCDYYTKVFCKLLATRGLHARYAFLKDQHGVSPHTIAEVYVDGQWHPIDPFFNVSYVTKEGTWVTLEDVTPQLVSQLPEVVQLKQTVSDVDESILSVAGRTFPLRQPPQRSDDFVTDRNLFDDITATYVRLFGDRFAYWYQDVYLRQYLATLHDPIERCWYQARHYHLYRRLAEAESLYRRLLVSQPPTPYRERVPLFLSRLLMHEQRVVEARDLLEAFLRTAPETRWAHFQLALCYERLHDTAGAVSHFERYQQLHGTKMSLEAAMHLAKLRPSMENVQ